MKRKTERYRLAQREHTGCSKTEQTAGRVLGDTVIYISCRFTFDVAISRLQTVGDHQIVRILATIILLHLTRPAEREQSDV